MTTNKKQTLWLTIPLVVFLLIAIISPVFAESQKPQANVVIYFFWGKGCPHCTDEKPVLNSLVNKYPFVRLTSYEVWYNRANQEKFKQFADILGFKPSGVPVTIICDRIWIGYRDSYAAEMEAEILRFQNTPCLKDASAIVAGQQAEPPKELATPKPKSGNAENVIYLPILGAFDLSKQPLEFSSVIIGFIDGFNPCSLWVLSVLFAITLRSGSRLKVLLVGVTFLVVSTLIYGLFIAGVFTFFSYSGYLRWIQLGVAAIAIAFALINLKDYLWYKQGISLTISDKKKPKMYQDMRSAVITPRSIVGLIASTAVFAVGVSFIEFSCTAGFPVIWSNLMIANQVTGLEFLLLLALYMYFYMIDEMAVFGVTVVTMHASKVEEKHGRVLKLISGMLMLFLGIVMIVNPELMNSIGSSLLVFLVAGLASILFLLLHQIILPRFEIYIGSDLGRK